MRTVITKTSEQAEKERALLIRALEDGCPNCGQSADHLGGWDNLKGGVHLKCMNCGTEWDVFDE